MKQNSKFCPIVLQSVFGILLCFAFSTPAIEVGWDPSMTIWLGDGVRLNQQQVAARQQLVALSSTATNLNNGWQNEIVTFAQHSYDAVKTLNINSSANFDYMAVSGSLNVSIFDQHSYDDRELNFVFTKTKNYGTTLYTPLGFTSTSFFSNRVAFYQNSNHLQGEALHAAITGEFGTHYVRGLEQAAFVSVLYTFRYASATIKHKVSVTASGSAWDSASFSAFVNSFFGSTNTSVSMSYQIKTSDSSFTLPVVPNGAIQSYQGFTNFVSQLENYVNMMTPANQQVTGYILDPIQSVPGYFSIVGGYVPPPLDQADYNDFLQTYSALQVWDQRLADLTFNANSGAMNWFNTQGQQLILNKKLDIDNYIGAMQLVASNHYYNGAPLYLPADVVTYLANLSDITFPEIYVMDNFNYVNGLTHYLFIIGRIDCGDRSLTKAIPFISLTQLSNGIPNGPTIDIDYDAWHFQTNALKAYGNSTIQAHLLNLFTNAQWACLTNPALNPDFQGYFLAEQKAANGNPGQAAHWSLALKDGRSTNIDVMSFLDTRSGGCGVPSLVSNTVNVTIATSPTTNNGVVGLGQPVTVQVANQTSIQSYGTTVSFVLSNAFDYGGASGSQGSGSFSNGVVTYAVGPLLAGATAVINLKLIPLQSGLARPSTLASLNMGQGLVNSSLTNTASFPPIQSIPPVLNVTRGPGGSVQLDWWSDTDRLLIENSSVLGFGASWSFVNNNGQVNDGSHRFLPQQVAGQQGYFRLHVQ
jgi:hypothetical protein